MKTSLFVAAMLVSVSISTVSVAVEQALNVAKVVQALAPDSEVILNQREQKLLSIYQDQNLTVDNFVEQNGKFIFQAIGENIQETVSTLRGFECDGYTALIKTCTTNDRKKCTLTTSNSGSSCSTGNL